MLARLSMRSRSAGLLILSILVTGLLAECGSNDYDETPPLNELIEFTSIDYEHSNDEVDARIVIEVGDVVYDMEEPETVATWTDGEMGPASVEVTDTGLIVTSTREKVSDEVEIEHLEFEWLGYVLGTDPNAVWERGEVQTRWGTFTILNINSSADGSAHIHYAVPDDRLIGSAHIAPDDLNIRVTGGQLNYWWIDRPGGSARETASMSAGAGFGNFLSQTPVEVEVEVWEVARDVELEVR